MVKKKSPPKPDAKKSILDNPFSQCKSAALRRQKQASDESVNKDGISAQSTKTNARKHNASSTKERSVDKRRKIEGPKTYAIDKILSRRLRASRTLAGAKKKRDPIIEYKVRWTGYGKDADSWVESGSISSAAVRDYESGKQDFNGKSPAQILATTPIGNHPSSVAFKSAQQLKAWSGAVVHLHDGRSERRHHRKKQIVQQNEYKISVHRLDSKNGISSDWEVQIFAGVAQSVETIAEANGVSVKVTVDHESFGGRAIQEREDNWSCGTYVPLLYHELLSNMGSDILSVWSRFQGMPSGVLKRKVNGIITLVHEDHEDETFCSETWLSSQNIQNACDVTGEGFSVKTSTSRPKSEWHFEGPSETMIERDDSIIVSDDESENNTPVSYYSRDYSGIRFGGVFSFIQKPCESAYFSCAKAILSSLCPFGSSNMPEGPRYMLMTTNSTPAEYSPSPNSPLSGLHWVHWSVVISVEQKSTHDANSRTRTSSKVVQDKEKDEIVVKSLVDSMVTQVVLRASGLVPQQKPKPKETIHKLHSAIFDVVQNIDAVIALRRHELKLERSGDSFTATAFQRYLAINVPNALKNANLPFDSLHNIPLHNMKPDDLIVTATHAKCNICLSVFTQVTRYAILRHLLSDAHMKQVAGREVHLAGAQTFKVTRKDLSRDIHVMAAVVAGQKSISFENTSVMLTFSQKVVSTLMHGASIPEGQILKAREAGCLQLAELGVSMNSVFKKRQVNQEPAQPPLLSSATSVSRNVAVAGDEVVQLKEDFLASCHLVSLILDESTTKLMLSKVCYTGVLAINKDFDWLMLFLNQMNMHSATDAQKHYDLVKNGVTNFNIWSKLRSLGVDGCHSMRSSNRYAGVDARGKEGENFAAKLKIDLDPSNPFVFHSILHMLFLALGDALEVLPAFFIPHLKAMPSYFSRSTQRKDRVAECHNELKGELKELGEMLEGYDTNDWGMKFPTGYCATRWIGVSTTVDSLVQASLPLQKHKEDLIDQGHGPPIRKAEEGYEVGSLEAILLELDSTDTGDEAAPIGKRNSMLHPETGPTDTNIGLDHMLSVLLKPMKVAVKQLQTIGQPIQHRVARILRKLQLFYRSLLTADALSYAEPYASWRRVMSVPAISKIALVEKIDEVGVSFSGELVRSLEERLEPYIPYYEAMEVIDPTGPAREITNQTWDAVSDICSRYGLPFNLVRGEIVAMRRESGELSRQDIDLCRGNLLVYYKTKNSTEQGYFSTMNFNKSAHRSSLKDGTVANVIHTQEVNSVLEKPDESFERSLSLRIGAPLQHRLDF